MVEIQIRPGKIIIVSFSFFFLNQFFQANLKGVHSNISSHWNLVHRHFPEVKVLT